MQGKVFHCHVCLIHLCNCAESERSWRHQRQWIMHVMISRIHSVHVPGIVTAISSLICCTRIMFVWQTLNMVFRKLMNCFPHMFVVYPLRFWHDEWNRVKLVLLDGESWWVLDQIGSVARLMLRPHNNVEIAAFGSMFCVLMVHTCQSTHHSNDTHLWHLWLFHITFIFQM